MMPESGPNWSRDASRFSFRADREHAVRFAHLQSDGLIRAAEESEGVRRRDLQPPFQRPWGGDGAELDEERRGGRKVEAGGLRLLLGGWTEEGGLHGELELLLERVGENGPLPRLVRQQRKNHGGPREGANLRCEPVLQLRLAEGKEEEERMKGHASE